MLNSAIQKTLWERRLLFFWTYKLISFAKQSKKVKTVKHVCLNTSAWLWNAVFWTGFFRKESSQLAFIYRLTVSWTVLDKVCQGYLLTGSTCISVTVLLQMLRLILSSFADLCIAGRTISQFLNTATYSEWFAWDFAPLQWPYLVTFCIF